ncbi:DUF5672 family protein [Mucilaginibacter dorajii]|uniref:DUF5672 domain-containing protein n=1 Tax=Mucilaginibacter dorajii TaxID=692994 RepID=A0ABP7Q2S5_9SPHI|nr:DUF5672 family protein [Mucilaginibacter dorajii]MCS3732763.1 hypothetical protein [Mucilaginibacter dorajii]
MISNPAAVIIPIYKLLPDKNEVLSMNQCFRVLSRYDIIFIAPETLDIAFYSNECNQHGINFREVRFADRYFSGIAGYNQLMLSPALYKSFIQYKYLLIYQLDAYVFKDDLLHWCRQGYDFIGAPAIPHENKPNEIQFLKRYSRWVKRVNKILGTNHQISNVGNGGFSLRNTKSCYRLLKLLQSKIKVWGTNNEDGFFKYWGNILHPVFRLPSDEVALHFSVEQSPAESLRKLQGVLPFGCHAFEKNEPEIWQHYIKGLHDSMEQSPYKN